MRKVLIFSLFIFSIIMPVNSFAINIEEGFKTEVKEEKYYKTTTINLPISRMNLAESNYVSYSEEITEDEYNSYDSNNDNTNSSATVETTYKKLTTTISSNGSYYRYKTVLTWKNFPKVRSYDTIAIGHYASVKPRLGTNFSQTYCMSSGECRTIQAYYEQIFSSGAAATFKLPTGTLKSLSQTFYFDVKKAVDSTIINQKATGDYAHAVKNVSVAQAKDFTVSNSGIVLSSSSKSLYDEIGVAQATWSGSW